MIFLAIVGRRAREINAVCRTAGIQCIIVERFLAYGTRHGDRELTARIDIAKKYSHQGGASLHSRKPGLQNRRNVFRRPSQNEWSAAEDDQDDRFTGSGDCL